MSAAAATRDNDYWTVDQDSLAAFSAQVAAAPSSLIWAALRRDAEQVALTPGFDRLITLDANTIKELPHQIEVARRVLRHMGGRAILADEVGLGKTIEAGIILKELLVRGLVRRVLILTPASLVAQWQGELESKFFERFETPMEPDEWKRAAKAIASYDRARGKRHASAVLRHRWDLVIIDEAHKVKNHQAATYQFIQQIERNYLLLLTATPLQNDLRELYNLVTLLRPGQLGTWREFRQRHLSAGDKRKPRDPEALKELTAQVMVRTRRASVAHALELPPRSPRHPSIALTPPEALLYRDTTAFLRALYREGFVAPGAEEQAEDRRRRKRRTGRGVLQLEIMRLSQRLCSSAAALGDSLSRLAEGELITPDYRGRARALARRAREVEASAKLSALDELLASVRDRVIVFSEHLPTLELIARRVAEAGRRAIVFRGGLSPAERVQRLAAFRREPQSVFVATRAGTEGLNLQFCNVLVNYELPWNPMVVEQRIGRIHRIGQRREVHIVNFAANGTIEAHVLRLLDEKIKLFELVVGELDVILGSFGGAESLEERLADAWLSANTDEAFERKVEAIGEEIVTSRAVGLEQEQLNSEVASEDNGEKLVREFAVLTIPARVRIGYGTNHLRLARGVEAKRHQIGLHVAEVLEALEHTAPIEDAGVHPDYGPMVHITGVTGTGRGVRLTVQADRLPMMLVDIQADVEAPLSPSEGMLGRGAVAR